MFFALLKTRYDINLVAVRQHIECKAHIESFMTYRKSRKRFISTNSTPLNSLYHTQQEKTIFFAYKDCLFLLFSFDRKYRVRLPCHKKPRSLCLSFLQTYPPQKSDCYDRWYSSKFLFRYYSKSCTL